MIRVLLVHAGIVPHYRVPIYGFLSAYLRDYGYELTVAADGMQKGVPSKVEFPFEETPLSLVTIVRLIRRLKIDVIIDYMELKHRYLFPTYLVAKGLLRRKIVYWGQGRDLLDPASKAKNFAYAFELAMCDAIVLYAERLGKYVPARFHRKVFIANNTLLLDYSGYPPGMTREKVLTDFGITTKKNIICIGRMQKRKRIDHLVTALIHMDRPDVGLILAGPDPEGILESVDHPRVFKLGPVYGDKKYDLLSAADVYGLPGSVGLSIVDAFFCGLPMVTEEGDESAEIMYLKDGVNGFAVPRGDILMLAEKLRLLLDDDELRRRFSEAARREIRENGGMDVFCSGFRDALTYATARVQRERAHGEGGRP